MKKTRGFTPYHFSYVYILRSLSRVGELYIGYTRNLRKRFEQHNRGEVFSTQKYLPWEIVYFEAFSNDSVAKERETHLKHNGNPMRELKRRLFKQTGMKSDKGFTLFETIIYIGLFALIMVGVLPSVYMMLQSSAQLHGKNTVQMEESFVFRKIHWALGGAQSITLPSAGTPNSSTLSLDRHDGIHVDIRINGTTIEMRETAAGTYAPITTSNFSVSGLAFDYIAPTGTGPAGVTATITVNGASASTTKYLRI